MYFSEAVFIAWAIFDWPSLGSLIISEDKIVHAVCGFALGMVRVRETSSLTCLSCLVFKSSALAFSLFGFTGFFFGFTTAFFTLLTFVTFFAFLDVVDFEVAFLDAFEVGDFRAVRFTAALTVRLGLVAVFA